MIETIKNLNGNQIKGNKTKDHCIINQLMKLKVKIDQDAN